MRQARLADLEVSRLGLGCLGMSDFYQGASTDRAESIRTIHRAVDLGVTLIDTAELYGPYVNEELVGEALDGRRDRVVLATKFGQLSHPGGQKRIDSSPSSVRLALEGSLRRLKTDCIDLYFQHRPDPATPIEDTMMVLSKAVQDGKIRRVGLSEAAPETIRRAHSVHPVTALQTEYSLWSRDVESEILPVVSELGIGFVPYSPLGRGFLTGQIKSADDLDPADFRATNPRFTKENFDLNTRIVDVVRGVAGELEATPAQVALAWLLAKGDDVVPIPGTKRVARIEENVGATELVFSSEQLARLDAIEPPAGERYAPDFLAKTGL